MCESMKYKSSRLLFNGRNRKCVCSGSERFFHYIRPKDVGLNMLLVDLKTGFGFNSYHNFPVKNCKPFWPLDLNKTEHAVQSYAAGKGYFM